MIFTHGVRFFSVSTKKLQFSTSLGKTFLSFPHNENNLCKTCDFLRGSVGIFRLYAKKQSRKTNVCSPWFLWKDLLISPVFLPKQMKISTFWSLRFFSRKRSPVVFSLYFPGGLRYNDNVLKALFCAQETKQLFWQRRKIYGHFRFNAKICHFSGFPLKMAWKTEKRTSWHQKSLRS